MEKIPTGRSDEMIFVDHLEELDDLRYGRNAPLERTEQNQEDLQKFVSAIVDKIKASNRKAVLFICSPRTRAQETARLAGREIRKRLGNGIKIRYSVNEDVRPYEEGKLKLPEDYKPGDFFEGLRVASKIWIEESLGPSGNIHYHYGDPLIQPDRTYKYPELSNYFEASGETYAEALSRILSSVVEMSAKVNKLNGSVEVVLVAHGFTFHVLRGLITLAEEVKNGNTEIIEGELAKNIYEVYKNNKADVKSLAYIPLDITNLSDQQLMTILKKEIEYLRK